MENIILLGIIPGPSEPKKVMNSLILRSICQRYAFILGRCQTMAQYV